ncbi:MAG: indolepyruvate oxidoreductase subunit beta [Desulfobacteraceae bacterium]|nr:indolepyruvate oxidoreductase subunit beta [Desulfobacteraceae bacterium]
MAPEKLPADPFNLVITGVGGQGNVMASRVLGNILSRKGYTVTIGETFGASQRGGSVMSHLRISGDKTWSPQIPKGRAHVIISLEPTEAVRVLADYGNPQVATLCNTRPVHSISVISGEASYPEEDEFKQWVRDLSDKAWFLEATNTAMEMGNPVFANIIMIGALSETGILPVDAQTFESVLGATLGADKLAVNREAFQKGAEMIRTTGSA